jgi:hypothetical protein
VERTVSAAPAALVDATLRAAEFLRAGAVGQPIPAPIISLTEEVLRAMTLRKIGKVFTVLLLLAVVGMGTVALLHQGQAAPPPPSLPSVPLVPWERVQRQLLTRPTPDGGTYELEELEPPLTPESRFLTDGESHKQALAVLDDFLNGEPEKWMTPLQRAVLQHDLWAVFISTTGATREQLREEANGRIVRIGRHQDLGDTELERPRQRRELQRRLVSAMRRLALSSRDIAAALPDNLTEAIKSDTFAKEFDPSHPEQPFLPPDLTDAEGAWLDMINWTAPENLVAPMHTAFVKGRSVFSVRLRLPGGRPATAQYLTGTAKGEITQFPAGTQIALLRRMLLIDDRGMLRPTKLTESVELRSYCKPERGNEMTDVGVPSVFVLSRHNLFMDRNGGLWPVGRDDTAPYSFQARMGNLSLDPFEAPKRIKQEPLLQTCTGCHSRKDGRGGVYSVASLNAGEPGEPLGLTSTTLANQEQATMNWVRKTYTWGLLQGLWEVQPPERR